MPTFDLYSALRSDEAMDNPEIFTCLLASINPNSFISENPRIYLAIRLYNRLTALMQEAQLYTLNHDAYNALRMMLLLNQPQRTEDDWEVIVSERSTLYNALDNLQLVYPTVSSLHTIRSFMSMAMANAISLFPLTVSASVKQSPPWRTITEGSLALSPHHLPALAIYAVHTPSPFITFRSPSATLHIPAFSQGVALYLTPTAPYIYNHLFVPSQRMYQHVFEAYQWHRVQDAASRLFFLNTISKALALLQESAMEAFFVTNRPAFLSSDYVLNQQAYSLLPFVSTVDIGTYLHRSIIINTNNLMGAYYG